MMTDSTSLQRLVLLCLLLPLGFALGCEKPYEPDPEQRSPYGVRCETLLGGRTFATLDYIDGVEIRRDYCIFVPPMMIKGGGPVDGVGTGGGGSSDCARHLEETPHQHTFENKLENVCATSETLSQDETQRLLPELEELVDDPGTNDDPNEPMVENSQTIPDRECEKQVTCGERALGQNPLSRYTCKDGVYDYIETCEVDCQYTGATTDDVCDEEAMDLSEICSGPSNGLYCGQTLGLEEDVLYRCDDGVAQVNERCQASCEIMPPGEHDQCERCPLGDGAYCGDARGENTSILYSCRAGIYRVEDVCDFGCQVAPPGFDDECSMDSTCFPEQEGLVLVERPWGECQGFDSICAEDGTQARTVGVCRSGQIVQEPQQQSCTRDTDGELISVGEWGECQGFDSICDEGGEEARTNVVCQNASPAEQEEVRRCQKDTDGISCGMATVCERGMCIDPDVCLANRHWSPEVMSVSDQFGQQKDQTIDTKLELELRDQGVGGNLEWRVCKYRQGTPSNFSGEDIHVYFEEWITHTGYIMLDDVVPTTSTTHCTNWGDLAGESAFSKGDRLGGQVRVIDPATERARWGEWCSFVGVPDGTCWYIHTNAMERTCKP